MLILMESRARAADRDRVCQHIAALGLRPRAVVGHERIAIAVLGDTAAIPVDACHGLPGVIGATRLTKPFKLVSREVRPDDSIVSVHGVAIGGAVPVICGGPCSVESRQQILDTAWIVKKAGGQLLRGGAYKPRTSPYAFQGLGEEGLELLAEARDETGLGIVTEALDVATFDLVERHADCIQIGARNMQNYPLLRRAGQSTRPILLKRGMSATLEEFLMAAEYILYEGNDRVILCERGVRTFNDYSRNTLDLSLVPTVRQLSHLPIIVDPSHGTGRRDLVGPMAMAAIASGASGLLVEVHPAPDRAWSDGDQSLYPHQFAELVSNCHAIAAACSPQHSLALNGA